MGRYSRSRSHSRDRSREKMEDEGFRVHVADLGVDCSQRELEKAFDKFGDLKEVWLARNPPCFAFVVYKHKNDAEDSIKEMNGRYIKNFKLWEKNLMFIILQELYAVLG